MCECFLKAAAHTISNKTTTMSEYHKRKKIEKAETTLRMFVVGVYLSVNNSFIKMAANMLSLS